MAPELIVALIVAFLGSPVLSTVISKYADKKAYERRRKDDKEDRERALKSELTGFANEMKEAKKDLDSAVAMFKAEHDAHNKTILDITSILKEHTQTINMLKEQAVKNSTNIESLEKEFKASIKLQNAALRQILGYNLKTRALQHLEEGEITYQDYEIWIRDFEIYESLGGNSVVADLKKDIVALPRVYR